ncbi:MAG TPA: aldo/keto reductase, partial [Geminicoccaceae bacterium]
YDTYGLGTTIWSPLASGLLTGKYNDGIPQDSRASLPGYEWLREIFEGEKGKRRIAQIRELQGIADGLGIPLTHLALAWCLANPRVSTVILGASRLSQLQDNLGALDAVGELTPDVMESIEGIVQNKPPEPQRFV